MLACSPGCCAASAGFHAGEFDLLVVDERIKHSGRVRSAADAGDDFIGQPSDSFQALGRVSRPMTD